MERIVCNKLSSSVADRLDPLQFAYKAKRGVEDATLTLTNKALAHLDKPGTFVRVLMMDFSSAFNTLQTHILIKRLLDLDVSPGLILWIRSFLSDRPQRVSVDGILSNEIILNTGVPQGCVLSPVLFSIYTNELMCDNDILTLIKFADDMALTARLRDENSLSKYFDFIHKLVKWFNDSYLRLNVKKTKEICFEEHRAKDPALLRPVKIDSENVDQVDNFKYLGTVLDKNFKFSEHVNTICKKANQRLYLIRKLKNFDVDVHILELVYRSLVQSILSFNIVTWYGNLDQKDKNKLNRIVNLASKLTGKKQEALYEIYNDFVLRKSKKIISDSAHPLFSDFQMMPSGRRFRVPAWKRQIFKRSFVPTAINILNTANIKL